MTEITLYHASPSRSSIVLWMLEELGQPYDAQLINLQKGENLSPQYLAINPMGKVPTIKHRGVVISEVSAICTYLAESEAERARRRSEARSVSQMDVLRPQRDRARGIDGRYPRKEEPRRATLGYGDFDTVMNVLAQATGAANPYLLGEQFTAADVVIGSQLRWGMMFGLIPQRPEFVAYVDRLNARPAAQRAREKDADYQKQQEAQ